MQWTKFAMLSLYLISYVCVTSATGTDTTLTTSCPDNCVTTDFFKQSAFTGFVFKAVQSFQQADLDCKAAKGIDFYLAPTGCRDCAVDCNPPSSSFQVECLKNCRGFMEKQNLINELQESRKLIEDLEQKLNATQTSLESWRNDVIALQANEKSYQRQLQFQSNRCSETANDVNDLQSTVTIFIGVSIAALVLTLFLFGCSWVRFSRYEHNADKKYQPKVQQVDGDVRWVAETAEETEKLRPIVDQDSDSGTGGSSQIFQNNFTNPDSGSNSAAQSVAQSV
ncbi:unnamed protein product [Clavelina lepadiformis]|uniref:Uncharacterized protein n=1 Tax=Clavelina lepadiformis TaxID=159417 RepID=A0ABP0FXF0_CLALP